MLFGLSTIFPELGAVEIYPAFGGKNLPLLFLKSLHFSLCNSPSFSHFQSNETIKNPTCSFLGLTNPFQHSTPPSETIDFWWFLSQEFPWKSWDHTMGFYPSFHLRPVPGRWPCCSSAPWRSCRHGGMRCTSGCGSPVRRAGIWWEDGDMGYRYPVIHTPICLFQWVV